MNASKAWKLLEINGIVFIVSFIGYQLSYWIQENTYGRANLLSPINELLYDQVFLTSLFVSLWVMSMLVILSVIIRILTVSDNTLIPAWVFLLLPSAVTVLHTYYEYYQYYHPRYYDNNSLYMLMGLISYSIIWRITVRISALKE